ncbi:hypothetical protein [Thioclava dalianensis]|uniref:hypothetical protein n=1 Tax=Thioclava dalianensis TaxID=1185766 RepID=UPI0015A63E65|nr:hypothetical protein [Thioclava dalianensis]
MTGDKAAARQALRQFFVDSRHPRRFRHPPTKKPTDARARGNLSQAHPLFRKLATMP